MTGTRLAPNMPQWMRDHVARYLESNDSDGHMLEIRSEKPVPTLLLTTTGRRSGEKFLFPQIYGSKPIEIAWSAELASPPLALMPPVPNRLICGLSAACARRT